jgi:hypothetical protein
MAVSLKENNWFFVIGETPHLTSVFFKKPPKVNNRPNRLKFTQSGHPEFTKEIL